PPRNATSVLATSLGPRRRRPALLALLAFLLLAQTLLVVHRIGHNSAQHNACALCVAADHSAAMPAAAVHAPIPSVPEPVSFAAAKSARSVLIVSYRSRAPPSHLLA
ncbi:MAG TPA: hypothetical protein VGL98_05000, partial [Gammaproteobacteria bacterium]